MTQSILLFSCCDRISFFRWKLIKLIKKRKTEIYLFRFVSLAKWIEFYLFHQRSNAHCRSWKITKNTHQRNNTSLKPQICIPNTTKLWNRLGHTRTSTQSFKWILFGLFSSIFRTFLFLYLLPFAATQFKFNFFPSAWFGSDSHFLFLWLNSVGISRAAKVIDCGVAAQRLCVGDAIIFGETAHAQRIFVSIRFPQSEKSIFLPISSDFGNVLILFFTVVAPSSSTICPIWTWFSSGMIQTWTELPRYYTSD